MHRTILLELQKHNVILPNGKVNPKYKIILQKYPKLLATVIDHTSFISTEHPNHLRERLYCIINDIGELVTCSHPNCTNPVKFIQNGKHRNKYHQYCSLRCSNNSNTVKERKQQTWMKNLGTTNPSKSTHVQQKKINISLKKYKSPYPWQQCVRIDLLENADWLYVQHVKHKKTLTEIGKIVNAHVSVVSNYMNKYKIPIQHYFQSSGELEIGNLIESVGIEIERGNRSIISPWEIDIYIPSHNLAIEYCGLYWHSEQAGKSRNYHKQKYDLCKQQNIRLLTIFEDEWKQRRNVVSSKILNMLHANTPPKKVNARECTIVPNLDFEQTRDFMNRNHIQGNGPGSIRIGLSHYGTIVAVAMFTNMQQQYLLTRFATSTLVRGGFTKILSFFRNTFPLKPIISFADLRWSEGELYKNTGWTLDRILPPDYYYSPNGIDRFHKFNYRRKFLKNKLNHFDPALSEKQNCDANGILRIWDCGKIRFRFDE